LAATAQLRIQHDIEAKAREGPKPDLGPRTSDMTIGEALFEIEENMMSDKFWVDLGQGVFHARQALMKDNQDGRIEAEQNLKAVSEQILKVKFYFEAERAVIENIRSLLAGEDPVTVDTPLKGTRSTQSEGHQYKSESEKKRGQELIKLGEKAKKESAKAAQGPFEFEEVENQCAVTVTIKVPAATQKSDVQVVMKPNSLKVVVQGHEVQPAVIDGTLSGAIDVEESGWALEGKDEGRKVTLELEKTMGGFMWHQLLK